MDPALLKKGGNRWLYSVGRLKPGVTIGHAQAELMLIAKQQETAYPETNRNRGVKVFAFSQSDDTEQIGQFGSVAVLLMSVVSLVLLIACANVANLLLARGSARGKENPTRPAIGATRSTIDRQRLNESVL